jgi:ubiquinone/menaquinone biosynthesis C-methylase UbiE
MQDVSAAQFTGTIPEHYERGLGPVIFTDYAADIARRVSARSPMRVLETAAGTGIVTRHLRDQLPPSSHLVATDLNEAMLDVARSKFRSEERVTFLAADATELPFPEYDFDCVVCQYGVMFFPDKAKSYREVRRVLAPNGRYVFNVWDSHGHNAFGRIAYETVASFFTNDPPQFHQVPFGYHQIDAIKEALLEAGFADITASVVRFEKRVTDIPLFARSLVCGSPLVDQIRQRGGDVERIIDALANALGRDLELGERPLRMQAIVFEAG